MHCAIIYLSEVKMQAGQKAAAYVRISTSTHGQDIKNQSVPIEKYIADKQLVFTKVYSDEGVSGSTAKRKGLDELIVDAKKGKFTVLVVMEISRLARDLRHLLNCLHELTELGISVVSLREGLDFSSTMGKAMVSMIGVLAQVEKDLLSERIKTALHTKKLLAAQTGNGWRCGRKPLASEVVAQVKSLREKGMSIREVAQVLRIGKSSVARVLK
jgi:DNA invertase Pin-like site-specific DNA recombinase